ncbi:hypothetical protein [Povalibacter sp.]|uniref:hypothetical protein n=1 Tax=Povalibacter sp. TaxID=1962978 RepID=UPI002F415EA1
MPPSEKDQVNVIYEFILSHKLLTAIAAVCLTVLACALTSHARLWWRAIANQYAPAMATAFFVVAPFSDQRVAGADMVSGFVFEFWILLLYCSLFVRMYQNTALIESVDTTRLLRISIVLQLLASWPIVTSQGFGLFSEGSRIEYLSDSSSAKYFTYFVVLVSTLQAPLIANRLTKSGRLGMSGAVAIGLTFTLSLLAGSKGGVFLWFLSIASLVDYRRAPISRFSVVFVAIAGCALVVGSSIVIADFLGVRLEEFFDIVLSRFFLNNDARALAFDQRPVAPLTTSLIVESFRSLATIFGAQPHDSPLGILLYDELFGFETGNGANASLMALIVYYSPPGYAALPAIVASCGAGVLFTFFRIVLRTLRRSATKAILLAFAIIALQQYSQDFLAFQVVMPLVVVAIAAIWLYDQQYFRRARPSRDYQHASASDRRHSRA